MMRWIIGALAVAGVVSLALAQTPPSIGPMVPNPSGLAPEFGSMVPSQGSMTPSNVSVGPPPSNPCTGAANFSDTCAIAIFGH